MMRRKLERKRSEVLFKNTARTTHPKNLRNAPMRGGYRL